MMRVLSSQTDGRHVMHRIDRVRRIWNEYRVSTLATLFSIRPRVMIVGTSARGPMELIGRAFIAIFGAKKSSIEDSSALVPSSSPRQSAHSSPLEQVLYAKQVGRRARTGTL